ncbi:L,D-transpeptidase family protein [Prosthecobacter sp.]|uniref:L,D-transpeptidase family protein n=1 Tax=Prosthecobacter sp. TaxID=1965333 RepID=UPI003784079B
MKKLAAVLSLAWLAVDLTACGHGSKTAATAPQPAAAPVTQRLVVSVAQQLMVTFDGGQPRRQYHVSTSRFGTGDKRGTHKTPLGRLEIAEIAGQGLPAGAKLKSRLPTGEIVPVNAPGRDPIVTRVLRLRGMERRNQNALERAIYIHGTPEESKLLTASSYGCIRMASADIIELCRWVKVGARVDILPGKLPAPEKLPP